MSTEVNKGRKSKSSRKTTTQMLSENMILLKDFIREELRANASANEVVERFERKADRFIAEFRDYEHLEHIIDEKSNSAVRRVDWRLGIAGFVVAILTFFGWNVLVEKASMAAISRIGETEAKKEIHRVVSNQVEVATSTKIKEMVPGIINRIVPSMIDRVFGERFAQMKQELEQCVVEKVSAINGKAESFDALMKKMSEKVETISIEYAARAGSRADYDQLVMIAKGTNAIAKIAKIAVKGIEDGFKLRKYRFDDYRPVLKRNNGQQIKMEQIVDLCRADLDFNCDGAVGELTNTGRKEYVATLVDVVKSSKRLETVYLAILGVEKLTGQRFDPLGIEQVLKWWEANKENPEYHSPLECYCDMLAKVRAGAFSDPTGQKVDSLIEEAKTMFQKDPKSLAASKMLMFLITYYPSTNRRYADGRKELCEQALRNLERTQYQDKDWYLAKAYYKCFNFAEAEFVKYINDHLKEHPKFEDELKESQMFTESFFKREDIDWPSKHPQPAKKVQKANDVWTCPLNRAHVVLQPDRPQMESGNGVGYVTAKIEKGKRQLNELPMKGKSNLPPQRLCDKKQGVSAGDAISWKLNGEDVRYTFDGTQWNDADGNTAEDVGVPVGETVIVYERVSDMKSEITFTVEF